MLRCASVLLRSSKRIGGTTLGQRASMATLADVEAKLKEELGTEKLEVYDTSGGCGSSFEVSLIVSSHFEGKRALERHRLVSSLSSLPLPPRVLGSIADASRFSSSPRARLR